MNNYNKKDKFRKMTAYKFELNRKIVIYEKK